MSYPSRNFCRNSGIDRRDLLQQPERVVLAAVVHEDQLERFARSFHHATQAVVELGYVFFLVVKRDDDGVFEHSPLIIPLHYWVSTPIFCPNPLQLFALPALSQWTAVSRQWLQDIPEAA
jgi:hypothetical protein